MFSSCQHLALDLQAISGIFGSVSIACWIVVFSPQIIENFRRSSAEGLSIVFIIVWLVGDVFNILGAVLQGVLPTMIILAVYYTIADIVLLLQCFYYRGFTLTDHVDPKPDQAAEPPTETAPLLNSNTADRRPSQASSPNRISFPELIRRSSSPSSIREQLSSLDGTHFSPATPLHPGTRDNEALKAQSPVQKRSVLKAVLFNAAAVLVVCAAGVLGWWLSTSAARRGDHTTHHDHHHHHQDSKESLHFNIPGQIFGYICALLYLGSRIPQLLLNYRRKSTEGISMLFFLFACIGNLTYVLSIFAYEPECRSGVGRCKEGEARAVYGRYMAVNFSWLLGSFGTLVLDAGVFVQYFLYRADDG
ncbi:MAG: hypothetical protein M1828_005051 [Chrysothrix sp. TS-e1954]|nr:MAG: hypothetical protein M1828_005051 [Chrysothrix sp. TS-e1954]